jgi:iron complex transport system permease protein
MGVNSGAGLLWLVAALWMPGHPVLRQAMAFVGALLATLLVYLVSRRAGTSRGTVVLAGVAVSSLMSAAIDAIVVVWPESVTDRVSFTLGGLSGVTYQSLALCVPALLVALVAGAYLGRGIDLLALGDEAAHGLGLDVRACRLGTIACAALLAASAVSICGLLSFVGLIVPNLVRMWARPTTRQGLALCALWGAALLVACDLVARTIAFPYELPVGLVLALLGAPFFMALLARRGRKHGSHSVAAGRGGEAA